MSYVGRHRSEEQFDRTKWAAFLYGLWAMRIDTEDDIATGLAEYIDVDYRLIRRWLSEIEEIMLADVHHVAKMCDIDAKLLIEKVI